MTGRRRLGLRSAPGSPGARIVAVGGYRPERVVPNAEICERIDSSDEWIRERSGIVSRRFAAPGETVVDLAEHACRVALGRAALLPSAVDAVIVATVTHMYQTPSAATILADRLGASGPMAIDLSAACSGFTHGVALAADLIRAGSARTVLVVGSEVMSTITDLHDRGSAFLFGDGAGAVAVTGAPEPGIGPVLWGSDGSQWQAIAQNRPWDAVQSQLRAGTPAEQVAVPVIAMSGRPVFRWAVWEMAPVALKAIDAAGISPGDLTAFIPHQANGRIIDQMVKQMQLPSHVLVATDITDAGNTVGASIPLAMDRLLAEHPQAHGGLALLIGFGAGLAYAAQVVRLPEAPD